MIAPMTPGDLPEVLVIEAASFSSPWSAEVFEDEIAHADGRALVWREPASGVVRGTIVYRWVPGQDGREIDLHQVAVHPDARRQGVGRALVDHLLADARARGARRVTLEVRHDNVAARALYERLGFVCLATRRGYYHDGEDALVLAKELA